MSEFLTKAQETWLIYRLIVAKVLLSIFVTFCTAWTTSMAQTKWSALDGNERFYTMCCIGTLIGTNLIAFFDKTVSQLAKGKLPVDDNGNTKQWTKIESNEKTINNP